MKICVKCKIEKETTEYSKGHGREKDGLFAYCKKCALQHSLDYGRSKKGVITRMYANQKNTSKTRGYAMPDYTKKELEEWLDNNPDFHRIYNNWVVSGYDKLQKPSCDRHSSVELDYDYKPYSLNRLRVVPFIENVLAIAKDTKAGLNTKQCKTVKQLTLDDALINTFYSGLEAERQTGVSAAKISLVCNNKRKTSGGFKWEYVD